MRYMRKPGCTCATVTGLECFGIFQLGRKQQGRVRTNEPPCQLHGSVPSISATPWRQARRGAGICLHMDAFALCGLSLDRSNSARPSYWGASSGAADLYSLCCLADGAQSQGCLGACASCTLRVSWLCPSACARLSLGLAGAQRSAEERRGAPTGLERNRANRRRGNREVQTSDAW